MEAVTQLTDAIQKLENNMSGEWKTRLGELRKQYSELLAGYQFNESSFTDDFREEVLPLAHSVEADAFSILCRREKKMSGFLGLFNSLMNKAMDENISNRKIIEKLFEGESKLKQKFCLVFCHVELEGKKVHRVYNLGGFVSILGDEGPTKTTVARKIYEAAKDQNKFEICAWVTVLPKHDMHNIYTTIAEQQDWRLARTHLGVEIEELHNLSLEDLISKVNQWLKSCSFIVVFDGCDNFSSRIILRCLSLFVMGTKGTEWSTVIFTTSNAQMSDVTRVIEVVKRPISFQEGWELLTNTYAKEEKDKLEQVGAASINQTEKELLMGIVGEMSTHLPQATTMLPPLHITNKLRLKEESSYTVSVSALTSWDRQYQLLSPRMRLCYLYMGLFPEEYEIPIRRLFKLWIAERLVIPDLKSSETTTLIPEDLAMSYLMKLKESQMISLKYKNERPKTCSIPSGDMYKFFSRKAMDLGTFYVHKSAEDPRPKFSVARLAQHDHGIELYPPTSADPHSTSNDKHYMQHLRSYISFNTRKRDTPAQEVGDFLDKLVAKRGFGLLRVLDLENVYKPKLPEETLEKLFLLAYLGLRWTFLDSLPDSVGALQYLETLDVKHTNITTLPTTIWKAKSLRHLYMNQVHFDTSNKKGFINSLTNLQTLWGLSIGSNSHVVKWLSKLSSLRKLGLTYVYHPKTAEEIANWVSKLTNLQSLRLRSLDQSGKPSCLKLPDMGDLAKLSELYLVGVLSNFKSMSEIKFHPSWKSSL
ncbi:disease resistance protein RPM1 [Ziziphus jujuba]|uniref:Disease resistance protein RPM1 n=1 Tax=Ziziphus jujuba TaxID=326968 RepID=A0A6P4BF38_ZIZJJ|nr:disease resistance protein RPM1 [Ziziphus jujuba]